MAPIGYMETFSSGLGGVRRKRLTAKRPEIPEEARFEVSMPVVVLTIPRKAYSCTSVRDRPQSDGQRPCTLFAMKPQIAMIGR